MYVYNKYMTEKYYIIKSNLNFNNKSFSKYYYVNLSSTKKEDTILIGGLNIKDTLKNKLIILDNRQIHKKIKKKNNKR